MKKYLTEEYVELIFEAKYKTGRDLLVLAKKLKSMDTLMVLVDKIWYTVEVSSIKPNDKEVEAMSQFDDDAEIKIKDIDRAEAIMEKMKERITESYDNFIVSNDPKAKNLNENVKMIFRGDRCEITDNVGSSKGGLIFKKSGIIEHGNDIDGWGSTQMTTKQMKQLSEWITNTIK